LPPEQLSVTLGQNQAILDRLGLMDEFWRLV
jgi:hypothetical protein